MKKILLITVALAAFWLCNPHQSTALDKPEGSKYEYAVVKWDGPDRLYYNLPDKFEMVHAAKTGVKIPGDAQEEEFYLAYAANKMAADGWEAVNLNSRRILFRRAK